MPGFNRISKAAILAAGVLSETSLKINESISDIGGLFKNDANKPSDKPQTEEDIHQSLKKLCDSFRKE